MSPILGIWGSKYTLPTNFESISTVTVTSGGNATITFSSIPQTYTHLQIRSIDQSTFNYSQLQFNSDTGSNYTRHLFYGTGVGIGAAGTSTGQTYTYYGVSATGTNMFAGTICDILDYTSTSKYKTIRALSGTDQNGSGQIQLNSGLWMSTSAINSITITANSTAPGVFAQYSQFALFGIK